METLLTSTDAGGIGGGGGGSTGRATAVLSAEGISECSFGRVTCRKEEGCSTGYSTGYSTGWLPCLRR